MKHLLPFLLFFLVLPVLGSTSTQKGGEELPWRGLMIDVSRHFRSLDWLKKQVDWMHRYGLNTLHLHLTDAAGWRIEIEGYPKLTELSAYRTEENWKAWWRNGDRHYGGSYGGYYTQDELRSLVAYARERGVTIVPEIEFPAHSEEVFAAYPHLCCTGEPYTSADFCIGKEEVFRFMSDVLRQVADIFPSRYLHVGGDEAGGKHWKTCPLCQQTSQAEAMRRLNAIVRGLGRRMIAWDECLTDEAADSTIAIMVWRDVEIASRALRLGHEVVLSPSRYLYLDAYQDAPETQPEAIGGYSPLRRVYDFGVVLNDLRILGGTRLLGLQGNMWTEYIPTEDHAESMLWPRALAIAELGTGHPRPWKTFHRWAVRQVALMHEKGLHAFDLHGEQGQRPEYKKRMKGISTRCLVQYGHRYSDSYPAAGDGSLTDGLQGSWTYTDGRWQGFIGKAGMDVTIDLGRLKKVRQVEASFMQSLNPYIYLPERIVIQISQDGQTYVPLLAQAVDREAQPVCFRRYGYNGQLQQARYIRFQALPGDRGGWIFCDEVIVR